MKKIWKFILCIYCITAVINCDSLLAEVAPIAVGAYADENNVTVIVKGIEDSTGNVTGQVSGQDLEDCTCQAMTESEEPIKTLILVDASKSINANVRKQFYDLLFTLFEDASENEEFCMGTFGKEIEYVTDYTTDRFELIKGYDEIEAVKQTCYLTDILSEALDDFIQMDFNGLERIIVFSDGFNSTKTGVSMEELYAKLGKKPFPIYTIGVVNQDNKSAIKSLFALSKITGGKSLSLKSKKELDEKAEGYLAVDDYYVFKAKVPEQFQDGSYRPISFELSGSEKSAVIEQDVLMFLNQNALEEHTEASPIPEVSSKAVGSQAKKSNGVMDRKQIILVGILAAVIFVIAVILILIMVKRSKKTKKVQQTADVSGEQPKSVSKPKIKEEAGAGETTVLSGEMYNAFQETTVLGGLESTWQIVLKDSLNGKIFNKNIKDQIILGRVSNGEDSIVIDYDNSVSKKHCTIIKQQECFYIEDNGSANGTYLNGKRVTTTEALHDGDSIDIGKVNLYVAIENM